MQWTGIICLISIISSIKSFDLEEFKGKHCHIDSNSRTTDFYLSPGDNFSRSRNGFICKDFVLKESDMDDMSKTSFVLSDERSIFFKNCEIVYGDYLLSKFPEIQKVFFDNCKISFKNPEVIANSVSSIEIIGFHDCYIYDNNQSLALQNYSEVDHLLVVNTTFQYRIDEFFFPKDSNISLILFHKSNIRKFPKGMLSNVQEDLSELTCTSCDLEEIDSLFNGMKKKVRFLISFADNKLQKLPTSLDVLENMDTLQELDLSGNDISIYILKKEYFQSMKNLKLLNLSRNRNITSLDYLVFEGLTLMHLNMSNVSLQKLNRLGNPYLTNIDFSNNLISNINPNTFNGLGDLWYLDISNNKISNLEGLIFQSLKKLTELCLQNNLIESISENTFTGLTSLKILDLSYNLLQSLSGLNKLTSLQQLYLQGNNIKLLDNSRNLLPMNLEKLDLSYNKISLISNKSFEYLINLTYLNLGHNKIDAMNKDVLRGLSFITCTNFSGNKFFDEK